MLIKLELKLIASLLEFTVADKPQQTFQPAVEITPAEIIENAVSDVTENLNGHQGNSCCCRHVKDIFNGKFSSIKKYIN